LLLRHLCDAGRYPEPIARFLVNRGYYDIDTIERFSASTLKSLYDPFLLAGVGRACERILAAIRDGERIVVHGDYDVDGLTATALLVSVLRDLGARVSGFIPQRATRGYGLHLETVQELAQSGCKLVITVDCGISAMESARLALRLGLDLIITDHHEPQVEEMVDEYELVMQTSLFDYALENGTDRHLARYNVVTPPACAVVNPKIGHYPFSDLAGVGVAFKLAHGLVKLARDTHCPRAQEIDLRDHLDLVALGTIADAVPLRDENRILAKHGLACLAHTKKVGLQKLLAVAKFGAVDTKTVVFGLAPRLNAAGRMADANVALNLLLTTNAAEAELLARDLDQLNKERQKVERETILAARTMFEEHWELDLPASGKIAGGLHKHMATAPRVLVLAHDAWNAGVVGIVASRMVERYYIPSIIIALQGERGRGSCRSVRDFHMYDALRRCSHLLVNYGGHKIAAGITIARENISAFRTAIEAVAQETMRPEDLVPVVSIDAECALRDCTLDFCAMLEQFKPYGQGNPRPAFLLRNAKMADDPVVLKDKHVRLSVMQEGCYRSLIAFNWVDRLAEVHLWPQMDVVIYPSLSYFRGEARVELEVIEAREAQ
jgi:single-stranded-DNA-specific exonuclease